MMPGDPIPIAALVEHYRRHSTPYLERRRLEFQTAEAYNRTHREAIDAVLAEQQAAATTTQDGEP